MSTLNVIRKLKNQKLNINNHTILPNIDINNSNIVSQKNDKFNDNTVKKRKKPKFKKMNKTYNFDKISINNNTNSITKNNIKDDIKDEEYDNDEFNDINDDLYNTNNKFNTLQVFDLKKLKKFVEQVKENNITDEEDLELFYENIDMELSKPLETIHE